MADAEDLKKAAQEKLDRLEERQEINAAAATATSTEREQWIQDCKDLLKEYALPEMTEMEKQLKKRHLDPSFKYDEDVPIYTLKFQDSSLGACQLEARVDRSGPAYRVLVEGQRGTAPLDSRYVTEVSQGTSEIKETLWAVFNRILA